MTPTQACRECASTNMVRVPTYKRHWYFCRQCGSAHPVQRSFYPFQFLPVEDWGKSNVNEESMYDYFVKPAHIEYSLGTAKDIDESYVKPWNIPIAGQKILDISGGNGHFINEFKKMGADVTLSEINDPSIDYARKTHGINVFKFNFNDDRINTLTTEKFDVIMSRASIMFCRDLKTHAKDLTKILKPGGLVFINHSVIPTLGVVLRTQVDEFSYFALRDPEQVIKSFKDAGFSLIQRRDETDPSLYVYDHDYRIRWALPHYLFELIGVWVLRKARRFAFPARDRRRSTMLFRYDGV